MANLDDNPWMRISASDYEGHMASIGQSAALREIFSRVYAERRPARVAILGCTTGGDLERIDPVVTSTVTGVDINPAYIEHAGRRLQRLGPHLRLLVGDVMEVELPDAPFDLVHAALLLEYVEAPALLRRIRRWLTAAGTCSLVTQEPVPGGAAISRSGYQSLELLAGWITPRSAAAVASVAARAGLRMVDQRVMSLPTGKILVTSIFTPEPGSLPSKRVP